MLINWVKHFFFPVKVEQFWSFLSHYTLSVDFLYRSAVNFPRERFFPPK